MAVAAWTAMRDSVQAGDVPARTVRAAGIRFSRLGRHVRGVVLRNQRDRIGPDHAGDCADVTARVVVTAARRVVVAFYAADDRFSDTGALAHLRDGQSGFSSRLGQRPADAHVSPPRFEPLLKSSYRQYAAGYAHCTQVICPQLADLQLCHELLAVGVTEPPPRRAGQAAGPRSQATAGRSSFLTVATGPGSMIRLGVTRAPARVTFRVTGE